MEWTHGLNNNSSGSKKSEKNQFCLTLVKRMASLLNIHWSYNPSLSCTPLHYYRCRWRYTAATLCGHITTNAVAVVLFGPVPYYSRLSFSGFLLQPLSTHCDIFAHLLFTVVNTLFIWNRNSVVCEFSLILHTANVWRVKKWEQYSCMAKSKFTCKRYKLKHLAERERERKVVLYASVCMSFEHCTLGNRTVKMTNGTLSSALGKQSRKMLEQWKRMKMNHSTCRMSDEWRWIPSCKSIACNNNHPSVDLWSRALRKMAQKKRCNYKMTWFPFYSYFCCSNQFFFYIFSVLLYTWIAEGEESGREQCH